MSSSRTDGVSTNLLSPRGRSAPIRRVAVRRRAFARLLSALCGWTRLDCGARSDSSTHLEPWTTAVVGLLALLSASCSFGTVKHSSCDQGSCQLAFGFGSVCGADGLCQRPPQNPRCTKTFPEDLFTNPSSYTDTIVIGNLADRSLATHVARENAAQLAIQSANDADGIDGRHFGIVFCTIEVNNDYDAMSRQDAAVATAQYLAEDLGLPAIVGPASSADTQAVFLELQNNADTLLISPSATSAALTGIDVTNPTDDNPGLLWRTAPPDIQQSQTIADDMTSRGVTSVAVVNATNTYGDGIAQEFARVFSGTTMLLPFSNDSILIEQVVVAGDMGVDEILFISSQTDQAAAFVNATEGRTQFDSKGLFLTDSAANADFKTATTGSSDRWSQIRGTRPALPSGPVYDVFRSRYQIEFSDDPAAYSFTANAYDAAWLVLYGVGWAEGQENGVLSGTNIARGLRHVSSGTAFDIAPSTFQQIVAAFARGESVDVNGASGNLDYDPATEEVRGVIEVWTVADL